MNAMVREQPKKYYLFFAAFLTLSSLALCWYLKVNLIYAYFFSVSIITFLFYGYDKSRAVKNQGRIPEIVLHILALAGGSLGGLAGQLIFRHKTRKWKFRIIFFLIVTVQVICILGYWKYPGE